MNEAPKQSTEVRLIALDLDGTALDPAGDVRPPLLRAIERAHARGVRVVACTGRRLRTAAPVLAKLGLRGVAVVQNGVVLKDVQSARTLERRGLPPALLREVIALVREVGSPLVYADDPQADFYTARDAPVHPFQAEYLADHGSSGRTLHSLDQAPAQAVVMVSTMAERERLEPLRERLHAQLGERIRTHLIENKSYRGHILEVLSPDAGKWRGIEWICEREGIAADGVLALGDDVNDAEMIARAGVGVAMANAVDAVRELADHVTESNARDGAALAIARFVLGEA